jgi:hypothetical protein
MAKQGRQTKARKARPADAHSGVVPSGGGARSAVSPALRAQGGEDVASVQVPGPPDETAAEPLALRLTPASRAASEPALEVEWSRQRDDVSVPPMGDLDAHFFEAASSLLAGEPEARDPRLMAVRSDAARRRRAHFARYVIGAVGMSLALCVAALVKASVSRAYEEGGGRTSARAVQAAALLPAPTPPAIAVLPPADVPTAAVPEPSGGVAVSGTVPPDVPAAVPAAVVPAAGAASSSAEADVAHTPDPVVAVALDPAATAKAALGAREGARTELGRGHVGAAIEAGERSVALDPGDGEAWLILGAAYQQKGEIADARRCYKACLSQGKRGPKSECAAMLR